MMAARATCCSGFRVYASSPAAAGTLPIVTAAGGFSGLAAVAAGVSASSASSISTDPWARLAWRLIRCNAPSPRSSITVLFLAARSHRSSPSVNLCTASTTTTRSLGKKDGDDPSSTLSPPTPPPSSPSADVQPESSRSSELKSSSIRRTTRRGAPPATRRQLRTVEKSSSESNSSIGVGVDIGIGVGRGPKGVQSRPPVPKFERWSRTDKSSSSNKFVVSSSQTRIPTSSSAKSKEEAFKEENNSSSKSRAGRRSSSSSRGAGTGAGAGAGTGTVSLRQRFIEEEGAVAVEGSVVHFTDSSFSSPKTSATMTKRKNRMSITQQSDMRDNEAPAVSRTSNPSTEQQKSADGTDAVISASSSFSSTTTNNLNFQEQSVSVNGGGKGKRHRKKEFPPEAILRRDLNMCSKEGNVLRALEIYEQSFRETPRLWNQYNFNILLYLCSSAALGTLTARKSGTDVPDSERLNLQSSPKSLKEAIPAAEPLVGLPPALQDLREDPAASGVNREARNGDGAAMTTAPMVPIVLSPEIMELASRRGFEIFEDMKRQKVSPNEATLTAVARLAVRREDGDLAFQMVKEMEAMKISPKLRSYSPALVTFCKQKAVEKAFEVDAHMVAAGVKPEEPELGALLQLCVDLGMEKEVYSLLQRLRVRMRALSSSTVSSIVQWFSGKFGASVGKQSKQPEADAVQGAMIAGGGGWHGLGWLGEGAWKIESTTIDGKGFCRCCKKQLATIDLDPDETDSFARSVSELACSRESKPHDFRRFQDWLERHGPFDAIIDGANVGLYNQNFFQGGFNFYQLNSVATAAVDRGLVKKAPLIVLHHARTKFGAATTPLGQELLHRWSSSYTLYSTPNGSNDDWYWIYAAVKNKCLLITNDEMRDHLFQLLGSDFFPKWKERHQVRFTATGAGPQFRLPPPYSIVIQESEDGSWHFPRSSETEVDAAQEWLCVTRPDPSPSSISNKSAADLKLASTSSAAESLEALPQTSDCVSTLITDNSNVPASPGRDVSSSASDDDPREISPPKRSRGRPRLKKVRIEDERPSE